MAWAFVDVKSSSGDGGSTTTVLPAVSTSSGDTLIVCSTAEATGGVLIDNITDTAGNTWVPCGSPGGVASYNTIELWCAPVTSPNANTVVTITYEASAEYRKASLSQYSGLASPAFDAMSAITLEGSATTLHSTADVTTTVDGDLLVGFFIVWTGDPGGALTSSGNTTIRSQIGVAGNAVGDATGASAGTHATHCGSTDTCQLACFTGAFKIAGAEPPAAGPKLHFIRSNIRPAI